MSRGPIITSAVDLVDTGNIVQARHELHQAIDFGGETQRAAWAEKWGEAALAAGEKAARAGDEWDGWSLPRSLERAQEIGASLATSLAGKDPDLELIRRRVTELNGKISDTIGAFEE
jgi:hypothetical protein